MFEIKDVVLIQYLQHNCSVLGVFVKALYHKYHWVHKVLDRDSSMVCDSVMVKWSRSYD